VLQPAERTALARQAIRQLRINVEGGNAWHHLAEIRTAQANAGHLEAGLRRDLEVLQQTAERRVLIEFVAAVHAPAKRSDWSDAAAKARQAAPRLQEMARYEQGPELAARRTELSEALTEIMTLGRQVEALDRLQTGIKGYDVNRPVEAARSLREVSLDVLPAKVEAPTRALRSLAELRESSRGRWEKAPDVTALKENVAHLERGLSELPGADAKLGKRLLQDLAVRAFLEGHPAEYKALMPADGPPEHAANLLRDLKALALGDGKITTWPAERVLPATEPGKGPASPRGPPPGLKPLIPEGPASGWRPPVRESARADLPPIEKAIEAAGALKARVETEAKTERASVETKAQAARTRLDGVQQRVLLPELPERQRLAEIEAALSRRLSAEERVRAAELAEQKKTTKQIVAVFQAPPDKEDEAFLRELEKLLSRMLAPAEREEALRMKKEGRKPAEVAMILGS
jgi:hypothetical protein